MVSFIDIYIVLHFFSHGSHIGLYVIEYDDSRYLVTRKFEHSLLEIVISKIGFFFTAHTDRERKKKKFAMSHLVNFHFKLLKMLHNHTIPQVIIMMMELLLVMCFSFIFAKLSEKKLLK